MNEFDEKARTWDDDPRMRERARTAAQRIREQVPLSRTWNVLEYGCGTGLLSFELRHDVGHMTLADSSAGMIEVVQRKVAAQGITGMHPLVVDDSGAGAPGAPFDMVYTQLALHHIADVDPTLDGLAAATKPEGYLCIIDLDAEGGSFHGEGFTGHHGFSRDALSQWLQERGLSVLSSDTCFTISRETRQGMREFTAFLIVATHTQPTR